MNKNCTGDFFTAQGQNYYCCFLDSTLLPAQGLINGNKCPHCNRDIYARELGILDVEMIRTINLPRGRIELD